MNKNIHKVLVEEHEAHLMSTSRSNTKLIEISCVIRGSNELTPTLEAQKSELENLDNVLGEENSLLLRKALAENKPLNLTLVENKPLELKSIFQIMAEAKN